MKRKRETFDYFDYLDTSLIDNVKKYPSLHYVDVYTKSDEKYWTEIGKILGMHNWWLKKRWKQIRDEHRQIVLYNHIHSEKVPAHAFARHLDFLKIDLNGAAKMDFEELKSPKKETFNITEEMLGNCDIYEDVTHESISMPKLPKTSTTSSIPETKPTITASANLDKNSQIKVQKKSSNKTEVLINASYVEVMDHNSDKPEAKASTSAQNERCEDTIFGELIVAMLKKMNPEEKKRAKKEIMNILL